MKTKVLGILYVKAYILLVSTAVMCICPDIGTLLTVKGEKDSFHRFLQVF